MIYLFWASFAQGQQPTNAEKIATLGDDQELAVFNATVDHLVTELVARPKTFGAFIALSGKDTTMIMDRYKAVRGLVKRRPELKERVRFTQPGTRYDGVWKQTEFWILPDPSHPPYTALTGDCACYPVAIQGEERVDKRTKTLVYSTRYRAVTLLGDPIKCHWKVVGGRIISGQGSSRITVRRNSKGRDSVNVELKVSGIDEDCYCVDQASFMTTVLPGIPPK